MKGWSMQALKAKNIHVGPDGKGRVLTVERKPVTKKDIQKALHKVEKPRKSEVDGKTIIEAVLINSGVPFEKEFRFHPVRMFRFDWFVPSLSLGIEYDGLFSEKSRHTQAGGYTKDKEKINLAQECGYKVYCYTAINSNCFYSDLQKLLQK